ncbi:unnamed protein product [Ixodes persulcatus]
MHFLARGCPPQQKRKRNNGVSCQRAMEATKDVQIRYPFFVRRAIVRCSRSGPVQSPGRTSHLKKTPLYAKSISTRNSLCVPFKHQVKGQEVLIPRDLPTLAEDALPTVFPNLPKYKSKTLPKAIKRWITTSLHAVPVKANCSSQNKVSPSGSGESVGTKEHHHEELDGFEVPAETHQCLHRETLAVPAREEFATRLRCPSHHWYKQTLESGSVVSYQTPVFYKKKTPPVELSKIVIFEHESTRPSVRCSIFLSGLLHKVKNVESAEGQAALNYTEDTSLCVGIG